MGATDLDPPAASTRLGSWVVPSGKNFCSVLRIETHIALCFALPSLKANQSMSEVGTARLKWAPCLCSRIKRTHASACCVHSARISARTAAVWHIAAPHTLTPPNNTLPACCQEGEDQRRRRRRRQACRRAKSGRTGAGGHPGLRLAVLSPHRTARARAEGEPSRPPVAAAAVVRSAMARCFAGLPRLCDGCSLLRLLAPLHWLLLSLLAAAGFWHLLLLGDGLLFRRCSPPPRGLRIPEDER